MTLKVNDTENFNIAMTLEIDWDTNKISIHIRYRDKLNGKIEGYDYPAEEFYKAVEKFNELENLYRQ